MVAERIYVIVTSISEVELADKVTKLMKEYPDSFLQGGVSVSPEGESSLRRFYAQAMVFYQETALVEERIITGVAIKCKDYYSNNYVLSLPRPNRHHDLYTYYNGKWKISEDRYEEGFVDDKRHFLSRTEAFVLAKSNGQLNRREGSQYYQGDELFSEDLW